MLNMSWRVTLRRTAKEVRVPYLAVLNLRSGRRLQDMSAAGENVIERSVVPRRDEEEIGWQNL